jgi:transmembrane sensor
MLGPGDQWSISGNQVSVVRVSPEELSDRLAWAPVLPKAGSFEFHGETLQQAVAAFNRYNSRQLVVRDAATGRLRVGGKFRTTDVDGFVAALQVTHGVRAVRVEEVGKEKGAITLIAPMREAEGSAAPESSGAGSAEVEEQP